MLPQALVRVRDQLYVLWISTVVSVGVRHGHCNGMAARHAKASKLIESQDERNERKTRSRDNNCFI